MKKILIGVAASVLIVVTVCVVFIATFDANRYKNQVAKVLADTLGSPVKVGGLSLGWLHGLSFEIRDLSIFKDRQTLTKPAVYLERASVKLRLIPLLQKRVEVLSVVLVAPKLNVIRELDGSIRVNGLNPTPAAKAPSSGAPSSGAREAATFFVGSVKIQGAEIGFVDRSPSMPLRLAIHRLDIAVKNLSFSSPVDFQASMAVFNATPNIRFQGRLRVAGMAGPYILENFKASTDFGTFGFQELTDSVPAIKKAAFSEAPAGKLNATIDRLQIEGKGLSDLNAALNLSEGKAALQSLRSPLTGVTLDATATENNFQLKTLSAKFARGSINASGTTKNYFSAFPQSTVDLKISRIALVDVLPPSRTSQPQIQGNFSASLNGTASGLSWPSISKTLNGDGQIALSEGVVVNGNILRIVYDQLTQIPGVASTINNQLPPQYRRLLDQHDVALPPLQIPVKIVNGVLTIPNLRIGAEGFELQLAGQIGLDGSVNCQTTFMMDPELTSYIAQSAPKIKDILDANGHLTVPVKITGSVDHLHYETDMQYLLSRVVQTEVKTRITDALQKALNKQQSASGQSAAPPAASGSPSQDSSYQKVLGKLWQ